MVAAVSFQGWEPAKPRPLSIATGAPESTYYELAKALAVVMAAEDPPRQLEVVATEASYDNMQRLHRGEVPLAMVQGDTPPSPEARTVATLFDESLHILVRADLHDRVRTIDDLVGLRVNIGLAGSGSHHTCAFVLDHLRIDPAERLTLGQSAASDALRAGTLDATMWVTLAPTETVRDLLLEGVVFLVPLDSHAGEGSIPDALHTAQPRLEPHVLPARLYGTRPTAPIATLAVPSVVVAHQDLDDHVVRDVTRLLHDERLNLGRASDNISVTAAAQKLGDGYDPTTAPYPYHPGAAAHYLRDEPGFLVVYAEAISLVMSLLLGAASAGFAFREWLLLRRKNRLDAFVVEIQRLEEQLDAGTRANRELLLAVADVHRRAFGDLVAERVAADAAFIIFQEYVRSVQDRLRTEVEER